MTINPEYIEILSLPAGRDLDIAFMKYVLKWEYRPELDDYVVPKRFRDTNDSIRFSQEPSCIDFLSKFLLEPYIVNIHSIYKSWTTRLFTLDNRYTVYTAVGKTIQESMTKALLFAEFKVTHQDWHNR